MDLVRQQFGRPDCVIACVANVAGLTYEEAEELLCVKGRLPPGGVDLRLAIYPLLTKGWAAVPVIPGDGTEPHTVTLDQIKVQLPGCKAIFGYQDAEAGAHAVFWDGNALHDCSDPPPAQPPDLDTLKFDLVLLVFRVGLPG